MAAGTGPIEKAESLAVEAESLAEDVAGGPARLQVILLLAAILGLDSADKGMLSAVSNELKSAFSISNTEVGLLMAVVSLVGAVATLPAGVLADRVRRKTILLVAIALWAAAMIISGTANSYSYLLVARIFLGAVTAAAWPCVASLTGDFFPARERASIYGLILSGELVGTGIGFFIAGEISAIGNWHWSFYFMALPSLALVWAVWRYLPEPKRGAQSWISEGETDAWAISEDSHRNDGAGEDKSAEQASPAQEVMREHGVAPREELILREDPLALGWWQALLYCLRIPSYRLLVAASSLAYYYFAGILAFGMIYFTGHYRLSHGIVTALAVLLGIGGIAGVIGGGRLSEWLLRRGYLAARITVPAVALFASVPFFALGIWLPQVWLSVPLLMVAAATLACAIAPIDAARLDIVQPRLWGRGEAGRAALRNLFQGIAPLIFGAVSGWLGGGVQGLMWTFLVMLVTLLGASFLALPGRRTYPRDVATAAASVDASRK